MKTHRMQFLQDALCLLAGALMPLPFAPFNNYLLAILYPALLLTFWLYATPKRSFWRGFLFGVGFFGVGISWIYISVNTYGNTAPPLAALITALLIAILSMYSALQGYILAKFFPKNNIYKLLLVFPALWVLGEWLRSWVLTGFPWLLLGNSQIDSPLRGLIPIVGVYGTSWAVALSSALIVAFFLPTKKTNRLLKKAILFCIFVALWVIAAALAHIQWTNPVGNKIKVAFIQGNIPQEIKWVPGRAEAIAQKYYSLTNAHWDSDLIIWPEGAITVLKSKAKPFIDQLNAKAKAHHTTLITGIPLDQDQNYYNAMIVLGEGHGTYLKRHLVPFGEYLMWENLLRDLINFFNIPMSNLSPGPAKQPLLTMDHINLAPFICYEIAYPELVRNDIKDAQLIVTVTDDSWFGRSIAAAQQLQITQMRALETGRYVLAGTNNGITAIINEKGQITAEGPAHIQTVLTGAAQPMTGETPWVKMGIWPINIFMLGLILVGVLMRRVD